jgi:MFS family permease
VSGLGFLRPYVPLFGTLFGCLLGVGASLATLPFFVTGTLGGGDVAVGVAVAAIAAASIVARPAAGRLADRRGDKPVLVAGAVACTLAGGLYLTAGHLAVLLPVRVLHGVGEAAVYTAGAAWLVAVSPPARRGRVVGLYGVAMYLGITVGALIGDLLRSQVGFGAVWAFCVLAPLAGLLLALPVRPVARALGRGRTELLPRAVVRPGTALALGALGYGALGAFAALHLADRGVSGGIAAFNAYGIAYVAVRLALGNWPDRFGARRVAVGCGVVEAAGLLVVASAHSLPVAVLGGAIMGAGVSLLFPALALVVMNSTPADRQGGAIGTYTSFWDLGVALGGPVAGVIAATAGYPEVFLAMAVPALLTALLATRSGARPVPA